MSTRLQKIQWLTDNQKIWAHLPLKNEYTPPIIAGTNTPIEEIGEWMKRDGLYSKTYRPCYWAILGMMREVRNESIKKLFLELGS